jgi:hypothetical protein
MSVRAVVATGVAVLVVCVAVVLAQSDARQAGTNSIVEVGRVAELRSGERHCQPGETVPRDAARLRLLVGTFGQPVPEISVAARDGEGRVITRGRWPAGRGREGHIVIPLQRVERTAPGLEVCVATRGGERLVLYGQAPNIRLEWLRPGSESWYALVPAIAHRFSLGKASLFGPFWLAIALLLVVGAGLAAIWVFLRESGQRT